MKNDRGFTLAETLLTVVILFTIASSLIPVSYRLKTTLYNKKLELYASEVAHEGIKQFLHTSVTSGVAQIDEVNFYWNYDGKSICVDYTNINQKEQRKCIDQNGELP